MSTNTRDPRRPRPDPGPGGRGFYPRPGQSIPEEAAQKAEAQAAARRRAELRRRHQQRRMVFYGAVMILLVLLIALLFSRCGRRAAAPAPSGAAEPSPTAAGGWSGFWGELPTPTLPAETAAPAASSSPAPAPTSGIFDFAQAVPASDAVEDSYFADAIFIGNSRTEGFFLYSGLSGSTSYASMGLNVSTVFTKEVIAQADGTKVTVIEAMRRAPNFKKVYIMLGLNELGWVDSGAFQQHYERLVDAIREIQPEAIIYVQSILPVSANKSSSSDVFNNTRVNLFNERVKGVAMNKKVFYLNVGEAVAGEDGFLPASETPDGVHLQKSLCVKWLDYLKTHTVTERMASQSRLSLSGTAETAAPAAASATPSTAAPSPASASGDAPAETAEPAPSPTGDPTPAPAAEAMGEGT